MAIGLRQVITDQAEQQRFDFGIVEQLHFQTVFQVNQGVADVIGGFHQVNQWMPGPALLLDLRQAEFAGNLFEQR
ncbi:hypothetical protein D3C77_541140 [compost metagenome]